MQNTSSLYKVLRADPLHRMEVKLSAGGVDYGEDRIVSLEASGSLFAQDEPGIGGAAAREIDLTLYLEGPDTVPRMARLRPFCRAVRGEQKSEWLPKGVFYIDTRSSERIAGGTLLTIHGFDAMLMAEQVWTPDQSLEFPMPMPSAAAEMARLMGVELDPRTRLHAGYLIDYPANDYTLRDILRFIAAAHGGNWIITDQGRLLLVPLAAGTGDAAGVTGTGNLETGLAYAPVSRVVLMVDSGNCWTAGDDSGYTLKAECPYAGQAMADRLLSELRGYVYQPMQAEDALLDPAAELGDSVSVDGITAPLIQADLTFDQLMAGSIAAPGQRELGSEYPYQSRALRALEWKIASTRSEIYKTSEEIRLKVETVNNDLIQKKAEIDLTVSGIQSTVSEVETNLGVTQKNVSKIEQYAKSIRLSVTNGETSSSFQLTADGAALSSGTIKFTGFVTFAGLSGGTTTIDGACIKTGRIDADRIDAENLHVQKIYGSNNKMSVGESSSNTLCVGGDGSWDYDTLRLFAHKEITLSSYSATTTGVTVRLSNSTVTAGMLWSIGTSANPWGALHTGTHTIYSGTTAGMTISYSQIYSKQTSYLGSSTYPWNYAYITNLYLNGTQFKPGDYAKSSDLSGYAKTTDLSAYATTSALSAYVKATGVYRVYGQNDTSHYIYINSNQQIIPSHTGSSYGFTLGTSSYHFYWGYFDGISVNGGSNCNLGTGGGNVIIGSSGYNSAIGFFGAGAAKKKSVRTCSTSSSVTASTVATSLNNLINALKGYGLIS